MCLDNDNNSCSTTILTSTTIHSTTKTNSALFCVLNYLCIASEIEFAHIFEKSEKKSFDDLIMFDVKTMMAQQNQQFDAFDSVLTKLLEKIRERNSTNTVNRIDVDEMDKLLKR